MVEYKKVATWYMISSPMWVCYNINIVNILSVHAQQVRGLIRQGCEARNIKIMQESVGKNHIHLLLSCPPSLAPSKILQYLKGRLSRLMQDGFLELEKIYLGQHLWARRYFCATVGTVTEEIIRNYIANQLDED